MKKLKRQAPLTAALLLVLGLGSAQAAINPGTQAQGVSGEMFLSVLDVDNATTYAIDLGTTVNQFVDGVAASNFSWTLGPKWADFIANVSGELKFNVAGSNYYTAVSLLSPYYGILVSQTNTQDLIEADPLQVQIANLQGQTLGVKDRVSALNNALPANTPVSAGKTKLTDYAANWDLVSTNTNAFRTDVGIGLWQGSATANSDGTPHLDINGQQNDTLRMIWWHGAGGVAASQVANFDALGGYMSLNIAAGTLNWNAVSAVPLPGAAWMFLGGLVGLLRFSNRACQSVQA